MTNRLPQANKLRYFYKALAICGIAAILSGCASQRPVLYPNKHYLKVGKERAELDVKTAMAIAEKHDLNSSDYAKGGKKLAVGTAAGAATGVAVGAISGSPGIGTVSGAAGGAAGGLINWLFSESSPSPIYKKFVETYLAERGYKVIGWK